MITTIEKHTDDGVEARFERECVRRDAPVTSAERLVVFGQFYNMGLLACCDGLHGAITGASDPMPRRHADRMVAFLLARLAFWSEPKPAWAAYDDAVRAMCTAVIAEWDRETGSGFGLYDAMDETCECGHLRVSHLRESCACGAVGCLCPGFAGCAT